ncbi:macro domain-containing protein [Bacillus sp. FJAT-44742]
MEECREIGYCPTGSAVITSAGELQADHIIHTVGPVWMRGTRGEAGKL